MKKEIIVIILKGIAYVITLILAALGVESLSSCTIYKDYTSAGRGRVITSTTFNDTLNIEHRTAIYPKNKVYFNK